MMDFTQKDEIKDISIDGTPVMMIFDTKKWSASTTKSHTHFRYIIWKKKPEYPYMTIARAFWQPHKTNPRHNSISFETGFTDKNGLIAPFWKQSEKNIFGTETSRAEYRYSYLSDTAFELGAGRFLYNSVEAEKQKTSDDRYLYDGSPCYDKHIYLKDMFMALGVKNDSEYYSFPYIADYRSTEGAFHSPYPEDVKNWEVSDVEWSMSDKDTGEIHLYAMPEFVYSSATKCYLPKWDITGHSLFFNHDIVSVPGDIHSDRANMFNTHSGGYDAYGIGWGHWPTPYYVPRVYETSVTVKAGAPLLTLSNETGGTTLITSIRTDFEEYKTKYEVATAGKISKSQYPYLRGVIKLDCKSKKLGIDGTYGEYIAFSVMR